MKKLLGLILAITLTLQMLSLTAFAADSAWSIITDKNSYAPGDYMKVQIVNSTELPNKLQHCKIHFTFNSSLIEYASETDNALYQAFPEVETPIFCGLSGVLFENNPQPGYFIASMITGTPVRVANNKVICTVLFKVKQDIIGTNNLNFNWVLTGDYKSYASYWDTESISHEYDITFVNKSISVVGVPGDEPTDLTGISCFAPDKSPTAQSPLNINVGGKPKQITTPYGVAFSKIKAKNTAIKTKAGVLFSKNNLAENQFKIGTAGVIDAEAVNFTSNNDFGILFYGAGIIPGVTYYIRSYVTYDDGTTLYGPISTFLVAQ